MINRRLRWLASMAVMVALLSGAACSKRAPDFTSETFTLTNGARLVVLPDHRWPIVTHMVWYHVGAGDESENKTGLAHFLEHLMFQHAPHLARGGFSRFVASLGGRDNAFTSYDYTAYFQRLHPDQLEVVMQLEAARMASLRLSEASAQKERGVVIEELHTRLNTNPLAMLQQKMRAALYGATHPYGRDIIGRLKDIETLTDKDALDFYQTYYHPANAIIILAGDIKGAEAHRLAQKYYGAIKSAAPKKSVDFPTVVQRVSAETFVSHQSDRVKQAIFARHYVITNRHILGPQQAASFELLAEILIGRQSSRLNRAFIIDKKIASFVGGGLSLDRRGPGQFSIQIWLSPYQKQTLGNLKKLEVLLDQELADLLAPAAQNPIRQEEITRAKNQLLAQAIYLNDNSFRLANFVGHWLITDHALDEAKRTTVYIERVTREDLRDAAHYMLDADRAISGFLLPQPAARR